MPLPPPELVPPALPSRYRIISLIGEGGMGKVFRAQDTERGEVVALKVVRTRTAGDLQRLEREIRALVRIRHEDVVRIFDVGFAGEDAFFTMELLEGTTLEGVLPVAPPDAAGISWALALCERILLALEHVHECGLIHGDIKPSNILLIGAAPPPRGALPGGAVPPIKLLDFGLALDREAARLRGGAAEGTPLYTAPERFLGDPAGERSDLYSVGAILYHLATARPPFRSLADALRPMALPTPPAELNPLVSEGASSTILSLISREPGRRPAGAAAALEALREASGSARRPPAPRLVPPAFSGRGSETATLRSFLHREGGNRCLHVTGEAGAGKTWLLERSGVLGEALVDLRFRPARGAFTKDGSLHEGLRTVFEELLRIIESSGGRSAVLEALEPWGSLLVEALGLERRSPADPASPPAGALEGAAGTEERLLDASARIVRSALDAAPLLVIIEGLHEADEADIGIVARMERAFRGSRGALIVTYRSSGRGSKAVGRWAEALATEGRLDTLHVGPLSDRGIADLVRSMLRPAGDAGPRLVSALASREGAMPLGAARRIQELWERGELHLGAEGWDVRAGDALERPAMDAARDRIASLPEDERLALATAGVIASPFDEELFASVLGSVPAGGELPRRVLRSLVRAGFLEEGADGYRLAASIDEGAAAAAAGPEAAARLHESAGETLVARHGRHAGGHLFRAARHRELSGRWEEALDLYLAAARHAARSFANRRALEAYERARELAGTGSLRGPIAEEMGELHARVGDHARALELLEAALSSSPGDLSVLGKIGRVHQRRGDLARARECFERCLEGSGDDVAARALASFRLGQVHLDAGDARSARERLEESSMLHARLGDSRQLAAIHSGLGILEKREGRLRESAGHFEEALRCAESSGSVLEAATILNNLGNIHRALGSDAAAIECLERSLRARERAGDRQGLAICLNNLARVHFHRGDLAASRKATEASLALFEEIGDRKGILIAGCNLGEVAAACGDFAAAGASLGSCLRLAESSRLERLAEVALVNMASIEADSGDPAAAAATVRRALRSMPGDRPHELRSQALGLLGGALTRLGDFEGAEDAIRESLEIARELELDAKLGYLAAQRMRWLIERGEAEASVREAEALGPKLLASERMGEARFRLELGRAYREMGPDWADRTEKHLLGALAAFEQMGSPHNAAEVRGELAVYWRLVGEEREAEVQLSSAEDALRKLGLARRLGELAAGREAT